MRFLEVKGLAGNTYVRVADVTAVQIIDQYKCTIILASGNTIPLVEPAREVVGRIEAALDGADGGEKPAAPAAAQV